MAGCQYFLGNNGYISGAYFSRNIVLDYSDVIQIGRMGTAYATIVNGGKMFISAGGCADGTKVNSDGIVYVRSGALASNTIINSGGSVYISRGGIASNTTMAGRLDVDGIARGVTVLSGGYLKGRADAALSNTTVSSGGRAFLGGGGGTSAYNMIVKSGGYLEVDGSGGGSAQNAQFYGDQTFGGTVNIVRSDCKMDMQGKMITFAIEERKAGDAAIVNNLGYFTNAAYYVRISENQADGEYKLAQGANNFTGSITVGDGTLDYGTLTINGDDLTHGGNIYSLNQIDGNLTFTIKNITPPIAPVASADVTTLTNGKVTVSAEFSSDSVVREYSLNGKDWSTYEKGIDFLKNGKVYFRGKDAAGNYSDVVEYVVGNIDTADPIAPVASADVTTLTNGKVTVSAEFSSDSVVKEYSLNGREWSVYEKGIDFFENGKIYFRGQDAAGNYSDVVEYVVGNIDTVADSITDEYVFVSSKYTNKINGKKQNGITLIYGTNAFASLKAAGDTSGKKVILLDSKNSGEYVNQGTVSGVVVIPTVKETDNSYSYKANSAPKGTLNLTADTDSTEFIRFATVNVSGAAVGNITGGKESSTEDTKTAVDKKGTVTDTEKTSYTYNANGKFTVLDGSAATVKGYATVNLTGAAVTELAGGNTKETSNSKLVDGETKDQKTISTVNDSVAAGSVTLKNQADADTISGYSNVTLTDSTVGDITNFTSKDSQSETATYDEAKNTVTRKVTVTHTENTAGTLKATNAELGDITGFATVTLQNVSEAGDFSRVSEAGEKYSTVKETLNVKTNKDGSVTGTYSKTETFTCAGKFTATGSTVGGIENFSNVTLDGSAAGAVSNFETAKIVTSGTALWDNMSAYGRPADYDIDSAGWGLTEIETESLNGSVTLKNGASATSITNFKSVTMTASKVGTIENVEKVTVNKGDSAIGSYIGTSGNDTVTIAKGTVLTANQIDLGAEGKDTLAINGTLILTGSADDLPLVEAAKITGKGEIAIIEDLFDDVSVDFANILNVGKTAENFRGTAYENADDSFKKAVKWDGKEEYNGWLGNWDGYTAGSDMADHIKFKAALGDELIVDGISNWTLLDKKGNDIGKEITAAGEYILKLENASYNESHAYTVTLA